MVRWKLSAKWAMKPIDCSVAGIRAGCHGRCCHTPAFWPVCVFVGSDKSKVSGCGNLGDAGCVWPKSERPVTCLLYPFVVKNSTIVLHFRSKAICGACHGSGRGIIEANGENMAVLFGQEQYVAALAAVRRGHDYFLNVPDDVVRAYLWEKQLEREKAKPTLRSQARVVPAVSVGLWR